MFPRMSVTAPPSSWPPDADHREAIDTLLLMAEAEVRWHEPDRALDLLENVEQIVGDLPERYERLRQRCQSTARRRRAPLRR
jgi:hypothetical protein